MGMFQCFPAILREEEYFLFREFSLFNPSPSPLGIPTGPFTQEA
jgi:hypothetical protein